MKENHFEKSNIAAHCIIQEHRPLVGNVELKVRKETWFCDEHKYVYLIIHAIFGCEIQHIISTSALLQILDIAVTLLIHFYTEMQLDEYCARPKGGA